nr:hypothetical protein [Tanacetum cinerariifolium]
MPKLIVKSMDQAALKEYDQKSAIYQTMHANKSFNQNPANHRLYHALMEPLIEDENAMDKGVVYTVLDHKRKHDDDEDNDDEDPLARPYQGKKTKRKRTKEIMSSKKPSTTKETPKDKALFKGSKTGKSALAKELVEKPIAEVVMDDTGDDVVHDDDQQQDASKPKTAKTPNPEWFTQPSRPPTPDPEWNKRQVVLDQPEQPWFNKMVSATKDPLTFNDLMATPIEFSKYVLNRLKTDNLIQDILLGPTYNLLKGTCHPGHLTVNGDYFFNNDQEYLKSSDPKRTYTTLITKTKASRYEIEGIEDMVPTLWRVKSVSVKKLHGYGHLKEIMVKTADHQLYKFKEGDFINQHMNDIEDMLLLAVQHKLFHLTDSDIVEFIVALRMFTRNLVIKKRVKVLQLGVESYHKKLNITLPQQTVPEIEFKEPYTPSNKPPGMRERRINQNLEILVGTRELEMDYKFMTRCSVCVGKVGEWSWEVVDCGGMEQEWGESGVEGGGMVVGGGGLWWNEAGVGRKWGRRLAGKMVNRYSTCLNVGGRKNKPLELQFRRFAISVLVCDWSSTLPSFSTLPVFS